MPQKSAKLQDYHMIIPKQRKIWLEFYPKSKKHYTTIGRKVVPFYRSERYQPKYDYGCKKCG